MSQSAYGQDCSGSETLQKHIYHPSRLIPQKGCVTVRGIIKKKLKEADGDFHVRLLLDSDQPSDLINDRNRTGQGGFLVFELRADLRQSCYPGKCQESM